MLGSVADELSDGETLRWLKRIDDAQTAFRAEMNARLDKVATTEALAAEQRLVNERFTNMQNDIADLKTDLVEAIANERAEREKAVAALTASQEETERKRASGLRFNITSLIMIAGVLVALAGLLIEMRGGR